MTSNLRPPPAPLHIAIVQAIEHVVPEGPHTRDPAGTAGKVEVGKAIAALLE